MTESHRLPATKFCFWLLAATLLAGCHRAPRTSAELRAELPRQFVGEVTLQGQTEPIRVRVVPHNFTERDSNTLEFNSVQYAVLSGQGGLQAESDASIQGTITLPDLAVRLENTGNLTNGDEFIKPGSFQGKLSDDLQSGEADWITGLGQKGHLKLTAEK